MTDECLRIEISRSAYMKDGFNIRLGDNTGSTTLSNYTKDLVLDEVSSAIDKLKEVATK